MEEWLPLVKKSPLFYGINDDELYTLLKCCASEQVCRIMQCLDFWHWGKWS